MKRYTNNYGLRPFGQPKLEGMMHDDSASHHHGEEMAGGVEGKEEGKPADQKAASGSDAQPRSTLALADALGSEMQNLRHLLEALQRQRTAIATSDVDAINENIFTMRRLLPTLSEARRYRRQIVERLGAPPDIAPEWGDARDAEPGAPPPWGADSIQRLRDELQRLAAEVAQEVETNRQILHGVIAAGEELIRVLIGAEVPLFGVGGSAKGTSAGSSARRNSSGSEGALINRTI